MLRGRNPCFVGNFNDKWKNYAEYLKKLKGLTDSEATVEAHKFRMARGRFLNGLRLTTYNEFLNMVFGVRGNFLGQRCYREDFVMVYDEATGIIRAKITKPYVHFNTVILEALPDGFTHFPDLKQAPWLTDDSTPWRIKNEVNKFFGYLGLTLHINKGVLKWKNAQGGKRPYQEGDGFLGEKFLTAEQRAAQLAEANSLVNPILV